MIYYINLFKLCIVKQKYIQYIRTIINKSSLYEELKIQDFENMLNPFI